MRVRNHRVEGLPFTPARLTGGVIVPEIVVLHDTAGRLERGNSAAWLASTPKVSAHLVVERDGSASQLVPLNRRAGHAGQSSFQGRADCNAFSIGIEIVNPGRMVRAGPGRARAWWGETFDIAEHGIEEIATPEHGAGLWMPYTEAQLATLLALLGALFAGLGRLRDITTHWYISPGRKVDTNPLFPLGHIRARVLGRDDPAVATADDTSLAAAGERMVEVATRGDALNLRRWPSFNPNVIGQVPDGRLVPVLREGVFAGRAWLCVLYGGREGWVVKSYTRPA